MKKHTNWLAAGSAACALIALCAAADAQTYPSRPVRLMVPQSPGSATDIVARSIGVRLGERLGQPVVIDNRTGASGILAAEQVVKAPPDGHMLLIVSATHTVLPSIRKTMPYDSIRDFTPITLATSQSYLLIAHPSVPARNVKELVQLAKARPGQVLYATTSVGSLGHLGFELLKTTAGINMLHVPYKGVGPALTDLLGGHVSVLFLTIVSALPQVHAGKLRGLAVSGLKRASIAPEIPTVAESGFPGFDVRGWYAILGPAGMPAPVVTRLNTEIVGILRTPELKERLAQDGSEAEGSTPEQLAAHLKSEIAKWGKVVKAAGIQPE